VTKGSCDPSPQQYNVLDEAWENGAVVATVTWSWDGVSVFPDCDGPVVSVRIVNLTGETFYVHFPRKARGVTYVALDPHSDQTVPAGNTLRQMGLDTYKACLGARVDRDPLSVGD
jgi:hypothetical protein